MADVGGHDDVVARGGPQCPVCTTALFRRHCKYVCPNHGVVADCGDPFTFY